MQCLKMNMFLNGWTLKTWRIETSNLDLLKAVNSKINLFYFGYLFIYLQNSPWDRWAYNRTLGPLLGKPTT